MDRKSIVILVLCFVAFFSLLPLIDKIYPPIPIPPGETNVLGGTFASSNQSASIGIGNATINPLPSTARAITNTSAPEELLEITNSSAHYTFSSYGGGLKQVELLQYPETVSTRREHKSETNRVATLNSFTPSPTLAILDGNEIQGDGVYKLTRTAD